MDQFWTLTLFSIAMFLGCYIAGSIPLALSLSEKVLRKVTVIGAGLLIGTALIVIIPEGIESLYNGITGSSHHKPNMKLTDNEQPQDVLPKIVGTGLDAWLGGLGDEDSLQFLIGISLVLGFIFMLIIDQLSGTHSHTTNTDLNTNRHKNKATATIGLVVHAAADGLALGAAAGLSKTDVEFVIFFAIMLHKAPAAFGFVSFLIHEGIDKTTARYHLLLFAVSAPLSAFFSYFGLVKIMYISQVPITGVTMLFSAGTFLYVATVHVLTEVTHMSNTSSKLTPSEIFLVTFGSLLPLIFNLVHSH